MVVHPTHAPIAYTAVVAHGRLESLALTAHAVRWALPTLLLLRHGRPRHRTRVREGRLRVTRQGHGTKEGVHHPQHGGYPLRDREEGDGDGRVRHQEPDEGGHYRSRLIPRVHPYPLFLAGPEGERPRFVVVGVDVVLAGGAYARRGLRPSAVPRFLVGEIVLKVFRAVYPAAASRVQARPQDGPAGRGGRTSFVPAVGHHG